jgi:hypothetical protein
MLRTMSVAVDFFWKALGDFGLQNNVTLFSASDFARTLTSNGNGSDHAWGGNQFVLGGSVAGGRVAGNKDQGYYPDLQQLTTFDTGQGRLIPGVAVDEYARDLLSWFGVGNGDMDYVLPAFSSRFGGRPELGLIGAGSAASSGGSSGSGSSGSTSGSTSSGGSSGGGGGGGSPTIIGAAAIGGALLLKKIADRKARLAAERAAK